MSYPVEIFPFLLRWIISFDLMLSVIFYWQDNTSRDYHLVADCRIFGFPAFLKGRQLEEGLWPRFYSCHPCHCMHHRRAVSAVDLILCKLPSFIIMCILISCEGWSKYIVVDLNYPVPGVWTWDSSFEKLMKNVVTCQKTTSALDFLAFLQKPLS